MRKHFIRLTVAFLTFLVGVTLAAVRLDRPTQVLTDHQTFDAPDVSTRPAPSTSGPPAFTFTVTETPEEKAVRLAEEFVARNGYTDLPPDRGNLSYESIEWESNVEEMLRRRHDSLERKAYGIVYTGKMGGPGWIVAFRHSRRLGNELDRVGRAVTMDENFENLRVEHKSFPLGNVDKKF